MGGGGGAGKSRQSLHARSTCLVFDLMDVTGDVLLVPLSSRRFCQ